MKTDPLVSVVIPTRNRKEMLGQALESVLNQSYGNLQIIIHDNNSSDGTTEYIANKYKDTRIEFHHSDRDLEMSENWNKAVGFAKGEYLVRLDDDNVFYKDFVLESIRNMRLHDLQVFMFSPLVIATNRKLYSLFDSGKNWYLLDKYQLTYLEFFNLTDSNYAIYSTKLLRRVMKKNIYRNRLPDRFLNYKIADSIDSHKLKVGLSEQILGLTRFDYRSITPLKYHLEYLDYWKAKIDSLVTNDKAKHNLGMFRITTLNKFIKESSDKKLMKFIRRILITRSMYPTSMAISHIVRTAVVNSWDEFVVFNRYALKSLLELLTKRGSRLDGNNRWFSIYRLFAIYGVVVYKSIAELFSIGTKELVDQRFGDQLAKKIIDGKWDTPTATKSLNGNLLDYLIRIENLKQCVA